MGKAFFARGGYRSYTGKSRCIPTYSRDTSGLTHATRILRCDKALELEHRQEYGFHAQTAGSRMSKGCYAQRLPVQAQPKKSTGKHRPYASFHSATNLTETCYIVSTPLKPA